MSNELDIAIIGMSCKFPQADTTEQFWGNLASGKETVVFFSDEELADKGVPQALLSHPDYIKAASVLDHPEHFDAEFFGYNPSEATSMDPQHRIFLENCWQTFEDAGYDPSAFAGDIGVFAGLAMNTYLSDVLIRNSDFMQHVSPEQLMIGNDKDYLTTMVSYKLGLKGPSLNVNTACSTSLVAIHLARQSLLLGECDMALAGGVSIVLPNSKGYMYKKDGIQSADGHCRAFDAKAKGTVWGDGCGVVLLKRLADAQADGDHIYAVIKGSAVTNDGSNKVGYTAPGVEGQSKAIVEALAVSGQSPEDIQYVEMHGTGTQLGDMVEMTAITQAYQSYTEQTEFCAIGSVKTNIGHLNAAAGIAGLIKTVLAMNHQQIPPSINYDEPNPKIDFKNSPFYVNSRLSDWKTGSEPRRAGVSSMGIGGTNCHIIIEEGPVTMPSKAASPDDVHTLILSARSAEALEQRIDQLADYLEAHPTLSLQDVAFTLQCGRRSFAYRTALRCSSLNEAVHTLRNRTLHPLFNAHSPRETVGDQLFLWLSGQENDWQDIWAGQTAHRIPLPAYPFQRKRFWVEPDPETASSEHTASEHYYKKLDDMADWFYLPSWKETSLPFTAHNSEAKVYWVFADNLQIGTGLTRQLKAEGHTVIVIEPGDSYACLNSNLFVLSPGDQEGYRQMIRTLQAGNLLPDRILFMWSLACEEPEAGEMNLEALIKTQNNGLFSILYLTQAFADLSVKKPCEFIALTNNVFNVTGNEQIHIQASTIPGLCTVMQQEYDHMRCRVIDLLLTAHGEVSIEAIVHWIMRELYSDSSEFVCAYRYSKRFIRGFEPVRIEANAPHQRPVRQEGTYLVFGGLEAVGYSVSEYIAKNKGATLLMMEEEGFPKQEEWEQWVERNGEEDAISIKIQNALKLLDHGAVYIGTIADLEKDERYIGAQEQRYGQIRGIVHASGSSGVKRRESMRTFTPDMWQGHFKAVNYSLMILDRAFADRDLDFRFIISGLVSVLGGYGSISIATVSNHVKAFVAKQSRTAGQSWVVQCWDASETVWGRVKQYMPVTMYDRIEDVALTDEQGIQCLERTFAVRDVLELEISATNLINRYNRWVRLKDRKTLEENKDESVRHSRPNLPTAYVAASQPIEQLLERVFSSLLGMDQVGMNDDFFELGGHSLLGVQLVSKLQDLYQIEIDLPIIYSYPTISKLSAYLESTGKAMVTA
ncbi:type I polyketide synthase [Paenibacillus donghaensis]|nr:type I polyketide synthase [Paenibacillus donghaensis]